MTGLSYNCAEMKEDFLQICTLGAESILATAMLDKKFVKLMTRTQFSTFFSRPEDGYFSSSCLMQFGPDRKKDPLYYTYTYG